jgi:hypothetical protein
LTLYEQKGNDVSASHAREFMAAPAQDR